MEQIRLHCPLRGKHAEFVMELDPGKYTQDMMLGFFRANRYYEPKVVGVLATYLQPGSVFLDIGAHIGYFSLFASCFVGPTGRVHAFEPEQANFRHLVRHIQLNGMTNLYPIHWAANDRVQVVDLFSDANDGGHAIWDLNKVPNGPPGRCTQTVFSAPLDHFFPPGPARRIDVIKIDVEGAELSVLRGAAGLIEDAAVPVIICECHRDRLKGNGDSEEALRSFLTSRGYVVFADIGESDRLIELAPAQTVQSRYIFNLVFVRPDAVASLGELKKP